MPSSASKGSTLAGEKLEDKPDDFLLSYPEMQDIDFELGHGELLERRPDELMISRATPNAAQPDPAPRLAKRRT